MMRSAVSRHTLSQLSDLLAARMGLNFPLERRDDLARRIAAAAPVFGMPDAESCANWLLTSPPTREQIETLAGYLTVGETYFFRDECCFNALEQHVLPELIRMRMSKERRLRIWSAACCTGEEPYSIAMVLDRLIPHGSDWNAAILATDINPDFLRRASAGVYSEWSFRDAAAKVMAQERYFKRVAGAKYEIQPWIRKYVSFSFLNLADDIYPSIMSNTHAMDIILCRNVMQYFTVEQAENVCRKLQASLVDGGWLIVAPAETWVRPRPGWEMVQFPGAIFYRKCNKAGHAASSPSIGAVCSTFESFFSENVVPERDANQHVPALPPVSVPEIAEKAAPADPPATPAFCHQARDYANQGLLSDAAQCCEKAIAADRIDPTPHYLLAVIRQEQGQYASAEQSLKRALYLDPAFTVAHLALGNLYVLAGRQREAKRYFRNALDLLASLSKEDIVPESDGLSAGRLAEIVAALLSSLEGVGTLDA